jgi:hypothetical protein
MWEFDVRAYNRSYTKVTLCCQCSLQLLLKFPLESFKGKGYSLTNPQILYQVALLLHRPAPVSYVCRMLWLIAAKSVANLGPFAHFVLNGRSFELTLEADLLEVFLSAYQHQ